MIPGSRGNPCSFDGEGNTGTKADKSESLDSLGQFILFFKFGMFPAAHELIHDQKQKN